MAGELAVWLYGERVAIVDRHRGRPRLTYTEEALGRYDLGTPLLSLSLPVGTQRYTQGVARPFRAAAREETEGVPADLATTIGRRLAQLRAAT